MAAPYILARTFKEAHSYANDVLGLPYGAYRVVNSPSTLKAVRNVDLHLVPGWDRRFDRFQMKGALRWTRMNVIDVAEQQAEEPDLPSEPDGLSPAGEQMTIEDANAFLVAAGQPNEEISALVAEPERETKQRRRRCKECGLLVEPDELEAHAAEHLPQEV